VSDPSSRFSLAPTYQRTLGDDPSPIELYRPRSAGVPAAVLTHVVQAGDRLDLLAWRYFGDPLQYWRIVDANPTLRPEDLLEIGRVLSIPRGG
jgi:nucleoid-associated protein YgaU